jgi:hypothetical protein
LSETEKQRDFYKKHYDDLQKRSEDRLDSGRITELKRNLEKSAERASLAEQRVADLKEETAKNER